MGTMSLDWMDSSFWSFMIIVGTIINGIIIRHYAKKAEEQRKDATDKIVAVHGLVKQVVADTGAVTPAVGQAVAAIQQDARSNAAGADQGGTNAVSG